MNRRGFITGLFGGAVATMFGWKVKPANAAVPVVANPVTKYGVLGDFSHYVIVDRIGMQVKYVDNLFEPQPGLVAYWRGASGSNGDCVAA